MRSLIRGARIDHAIDTSREAARKELETLAKNAAAVRRNLDELGEAARRILGLNAFRRDLSRFDDVERQRLQDDLWRGELGLDSELAEVGRHQYEKLCSGIDDILAAVGQKVAKAGRPSKRLDGPNSTPLDYLAAGFYALSLDGGWRVTIEPEAGKGTVVDFLRLAAPYLPAGFLPPDLLCPTSKGSCKGLKRLQRLGTRLRRAV